MRSEQLTALLESVEAGFNGLDKLNGHHAKHHEEDGTDLLLDTDVAEAFHHLRRAMAILRSLSPDPKPEPPWSTCSKCRGRRKIINTESFSHGHASSCGWAKAGFKYDLSTCDCNLTVWCPSCQEGRDA